MAVVFSKLWTHSREKAVDLKRARNDSELNLGK